MALNDWVRKATFTSADLTGGTDGGLLSPQQATQFIQVAIDSTVMAREGRIEMHSSTKFEVPRLSLASRVLRVGVEGERVGTTGAYGDNVKPVTGLVTLSTNLFKGEIKVADEAFEDNIERDGFADTLATMLAEAVGRDIEEIGIKSDTSRDPAGADVADGTEAYLFDQTNGIIASMEDEFAAGQKVNAAAIATYDDLFSEMIEALPARYRRNYGALRFYVPVVHKDGYQKELAGRGTGLGDQAVVTNMQTSLAFRGIKVVEVPLLAGTSLIAGSTVDYSKFAILCDPKNIIWGFHRRVRIERFRDPREGVTSYLPTVRFDVKVADPNYGVLAYGIAL